MGFHLPWANTVIYGVIYLGQTHSFMGIISLGKPQSYMRFISLGQMQSHVFPSRMFTYTMDLFPSCGFSIIVTYHLFLLHLYKSSNQLDRAFISIRQTFNAQLNPSKSR